MRYPCFHVPIRLQTWRKVRPHGTKESSFWTYFWTSTVHQILHVEKVAAGANSTRESCTMEAQHYARAWRIYSEALHLSPKGATYTPQRLKWEFIFSFFFRDLQCNSQFWIYGIYLNSGLWKHWGIFKGLFISPVKYFCEKLILWGADSHPRLCNCAIHKDSFPAAFHRNREPHAHVMSKPWQTLNLLHAVNLWLFVRRGFIDPKSQLRTESWW